jgi:hypothetical protein
MATTIPGFPNISTSVFNGTTFEPELAPMSKGKAKSWLGEFHWVSLPVTDKNKYDDTTTPALAWCQEHFGKSGARWFEKDKKFYFKDERDVTMFILRYS